MSNIASQNISTQQLFLGTFRNITGTYTSGGSAVTLKAGTIFGRNTSTSKVEPTQSDGSTGSQQPRYILVDDVTVAANTTVTLNLANVGRVNKLALVYYKSGDGFDTMVGTSGTIGDLLVSNSLLEIIGSTEASTTDNVVS